MKTSLRSCLFALSLSTVLLPAMAEDIDIFTGMSAGTAINANVLIVIDNTPNWSRQSQGWPGGLTQGESEARAIDAVISALDGSVNIGLMEFVTGGTSNDNGGYVRFPVTPMTPDNKAGFKGQLKKIQNNIGGVEEKTNGSRPYGNLMYDVYNYFAGGNSYSPGGVIGSLVTTAKTADDGNTNGYSTNYTKFQSPLTSTNTCAPNFVIFIGNPNASGPLVDNAANTTALKNLGIAAGDSSAAKQLGLPDIITVQAPNSITLGNTSQCYSSTGEAQTACGWGLLDTEDRSQCFVNSATETAFQSACSGYTQGCSIGIASSTSSCPAGKNQYRIIGSNLVATNAAGTNLTTDTGPRNADEWAKFLFKSGVPQSYDPTSTIRPSVTTYTIDVYNKQPNAEQTSLLLSMAMNGGGKYFAATNEDAIKLAIQKILAEIKGTNTAFASTSLPVNATNRTQNANQVFIGMFRPDPSANPRWFGNLKRYQLIDNAGRIELGDSEGTIAVQTLTGFLTDCAVSYWTTNSNSYWDGVTDGGFPTAQKLKTETVLGRCPGQQEYSDSPDGPLVEKGAVAEVLRQGNNPPGSSTAPTWSVNRTVYTQSGGSLVPFTLGSSGLSSQSLVNFTMGYDINKEKSTDITKTRPSIHGDVIHSRPLPINYGEQGIVVFYGANDGTFRAVDAETGKEKWAFIAPEFSDNLPRLMSNSPLVKYPASVVPDATPKPYFFDGSTGVYQNAGTKAGDTVVWIYPTMRRGGRMLYALDVSNPAIPSLKWKVGCDNNGTCTTGMEEIGQTWSTPNVALIKNASGAPTKIIAVGGGYDSCEDTDSVITTECNSTKGGFIYILDADTGELLRSFSTERSVAADVSYVDTDGDGLPDFAYAADTGGNIYRVDFINYQTGAALGKALWTRYKVARTTGGGRKFLFTPALLANKGKVYVAIGSGDREHPLKSQYPYQSNVHNRFYVYMDDLLTKPAPDAAPVDLDSMSNYSTNSTCDTPPVLPDSGLQGWYMNLDQHGTGDDAGRGEQTVTSALIVGGLVTFSTNRPVTVSNSCSASLGEANGYWVNLLNGAGAIDVSGTCGGKRSSIFVGGGLPPSPVLASSVPIGKRNVTVVIGAARRNDGGANVTISPQEINPAIKSKRKRVYSYSKGEN